MTIDTGNRYVAFSIGSDGRVHRFVDIRTGVNHVVPAPLPPFARIRRAGREYASTAARREGENVALQFGDSGVSAVVKIAASDRYLTISVAELDGDDVDEFTFFDVRLAAGRPPADGFAACVLALNLQTNCPELPGPNTRLRAICYPRFGFAGARAALVACPLDEMRSILQEVVREAADVPQSDLGGPWAMDAPINRGSYLFDFGNLTEQNVDEWIRLARGIGFNQIDFHGGRSFSFGDFQPHPQLYPEGRKSLRAVIDRLHEAGIAAGLHTYAFFISKGSPYGTPVPDPRLGKDAAFTLATPITAESGTVPVLETTRAMSTVTGFFVRNSVTLQIDEELITYTGIRKEPPYAFTGCERGVWGTRAGPHEKGSKVHHLKECFGLYSPDGDSSLLTEIAANTAEMFNECGFDMIYLDALDAGDILEGEENEWHYGARFVFELCRRLNKPALMEMSTFYHHLWFVRSRMGAWDHPTRAYRTFIDRHVAANEATRRMFLPANLGWWSVLPWGGAGREPTFSDDLEYLCCKALGTGDSLSLMGIGPGSLEANETFKRLAGIVKRYEDLRHAACVAEHMKAKLREPGNDFTLVGGPGERWSFRPARHSKHKVADPEGRDKQWRVENPFGEQPLRVRIEALASVGPYDAPEGVVLADWSATSEFTDRASAPGVGADLQPSADTPKDGDVTASFTATNTDTDPREAWGMVRRNFVPPIDIGRKGRSVHVEGAAQIRSGDQQHALGVWVQGDGRGELLVVRLRSPRHVSGAVADRPIVVDFKDRRYFELVEPEVEHFDDCRWPRDLPMPGMQQTGDEPAQHWHLGGYDLYRESIDDAQIASLSLWYNRIPPHSAIACCLGPIKALPLLHGKFRNPSLTVNGSTMVLPVEMETGQVLEFSAPDACRLYGADGALIAPLRPEGRALLLRPGHNEISFDFEAVSAARPRARVTVIGYGEDLEP